MTVYLGADHRGFSLKETLKQFLIERNYQVVDLGNTRHDENDDYPEFAAKVAEKVSGDPETSRGVVICGSGIGVDVVANKFRGVRSALAISLEQARTSRNDDDANVLSLAADTTDEFQAEEIVMKFLETPFSGEERHRRRIEEIANIERKIKEGGL